MATKSQAQHVRVPLREGPHAFTHDASRHVLQCSRAAPPVRKSYAGGPHARRDGIWRPGTLSASRWFVENPTTLFRTFDALNRTIQARVCSLPSAALQGSDVCCRRYHGDPKPHGRHRK